MSQRDVRASWSEIDPYIEGFERTMSERGLAEIADYLPAPDDELYPVVLRELVRADLEFHWGSGRPKRVESYLSAFPSLGEDRAGLSEIAFEEFRLRCHAGESPSPEEYRSRLGVDLRARAPWYEASPAVPSMGGGGEEAAADRWFDGFELTAELGRGASGRVYLARQRDLADRLVVLKVSADLAGEELSLAQLQHSNIVPVYSVHRKGPLQAICMPYFGASTFADVLSELRASGAVPDSGGWLAELIRRHGRTAKPVSEAALQDLERRSYIDAILVLGSQLAEGLAYAHERGIVHRDIKPANLLLSDEGRPMILDFNLSADARRDGASPAMIGGTLPYMSPESLEAFRDGSGRLDASGDLYALGLILYELLAGAPPFPVGQGTIQEILDRSIRGRRGPSPDPRGRNAAISPAVASILARCLAPDPSRRYRSAQELREDIERHLSDRPLRHARDPSPRERAAKWVRRHPRLTSSYIVGAIAATLLLALGGLYARRGHRLATFEAAHNLEQFRDEARTGRFLLSSPSAHPEEKSTGLALIRRASARFHVLERTD
jgi:serine/threonine protein kinase